MRDKRKNTPKAVSSNQETQEVENPEYDNIIKLLNENPERKNIFLKHPDWKKRVKKLLKDPNTLKEFNNNELRLLKEANYDPGVVTHSRRSAL